MLDINGQPIHEGDTAQILCEVIEISARGVLVRVMNSELQLLVDAKHDEVLGGLVVGSELTLFESANREPDPEPTKCLCIVGCSVNGECPIHGDGASRIELNNA